MHISISSFLRLRSALLSGPSRSEGHDHDRSLVLRTGFVCARLNRQRARPRIRKRERKRNDFSKNYLFFGGLLSRPPPEGLPGFLLGQPPFPRPPPRLPKFSPPLFGFVVSSCSHHFCAILLGNRFIFKLCALRNE